MVMSRTHGEAETRTLKERRGYSALSVAQSAGRWGSGRRALGRRRHKYWGWGVRSAPKRTGTKQLNPELPSTLPLLPSQL